MPVVTLVSAKGSPGVTTAAAAIAAAATVDAPALLVELDPAGGDVRILTGAADDGGLVGAAGELRRDVSSESIGRHISVAPPGVPVLLAPTAGLMATSVIGSVLDRWGPALRQHGGTVVVDAGRWDAGQPTARRVGIGDVVAMVCRPTVGGVEHARQTIDRLREVARRPVVALVVGSRPYAPAEVAAELDLPLAGAIAWDLRGAAALWAKGVTRSWGRTWLAASAADTLAGLTRLLPPEPATPFAGRPPAPRHRSTAPAVTPASERSVTPSSSPTPAPPAPSSTGHVPSGPERSVTPSSSPAPSQPEDRSSEAKRTGPPSSASAPGHVSSGPGRPGPPAPPSATAEPQPATEAGRRGGSQPQPPPPPPAPPRPPTGGDSPGRAPARLPAGGQASPPPPPAPPRPPTGEHGSGNAAARPPVGGQASPPPPGDQPAGYVRPGDGRPVPDQRGGPDQSLGGPGPVGAAAWPAVVRPAGPGRDGGAPTGSTDHAGHVGHDRLAGPGRDGGAPAGSTDHAGHVGHDRHAGPGDRGQRDADAEPAENAEHVRAVER